MKDLAQRRREWEAQKAAIDEICGAPAAQANENTASIAFDDLLDTILSMRVTTSNGIRLKVKTADLAGADDVITSIREDLLQFGHAT